MKHSFLIWGIVLLFVTGTAVASALVIYGVLPNTADDANLEYIDIYNDSCQPIPLVGISLRDLSGKKYTFTWGILESGAYRRVSRIESKIILNNTDETLDILDSSGNSMNQIHYATSFRDIPIQWNVSTPNCHVETVEETVVETLPVEWPVEISGTGNAQGSGSTDSSNTVSASGSTETNGAVSTSSGAIVSESGSVAVSSPVVTATGSAATGSVSPESGITIVLESVESTSGSGAGAAVATSVGALSSTGSATETPVPVPTPTVPIPVIPPVDTSVLTPLKLYLYDSDSNGKIDRLSVEYSGMLSGSLNPEKFLLYSASGGLADHDIETGSGIVRTLGYSGSYLIVDIYEQNLAHTNLRISSATSSELRLKNLSGFGLTNISGIPVLSLTLTQSFNGYDAAHIVNTTATSALPVTGQSTQLNYTPSSSPANDTTPSSVTTRVLPEPSIIFQSGVTVDGACKTASCRVNFTHEVQEKFEMCRWNVVSTNALQVIDGCNPKPITLGGSGGVVGLTLLDSAGILPFQSRNFRILPYSEIASAKTNAPMSTKATTTSVKTPAPSAKTSKSSTISQKASSTVASEISPAVSAKKVTTKTSSPKATKVPSTAKTATAKATATKTTTKKTTTTTKSPAVPKEPKAVPISPAYQKSDTPSDSVTIGIIGIACAGIGFCVALLRRKDAEPVE